MTKATRLTCVAILIGVTGGAWAWSSTGAADRAQQAKPPVANAADPVRVLRKERLATLEAIRDMIQKQYEHGSATAMEVEQAFAEVLHARLEISELPQERIAICQESVKLAEVRVRMTEARIESAIGVPSDVLRSKVGMLDAKIALEREKAGRIETHSAPRVCVTHHFE